MGSPGAPVRILGATFKPGSDDAGLPLDVAQIIQAMGAEVTVYDPIVPCSCSPCVPGIGLRCDGAEAARDVHVMLLLTQLAEFAEPRPTTWIPW
jgi:UDP-glucose 6-dehydrogenase